MSYEVGIINVMYKLRQEAVGREMKPMTLRTGHTQIILTQQLTALASLPSCILNHLSPGGRLTQWALRSFTSSTPHRLATKEQKEWEVKFRISQLNGY